MTSTELDRSGPRQVSEREGGRGWGEISQRGEFIEFGSLELSLALSLQFRLSHTPSPATSQTLSQTCRTRHST